MRRAALCLVVLTVVAAVPAQAKVTRYLTGNAADVSPVLAGPADTGLTNPASCPSTFTFSANNGTFMYAYVS